MAEHPSLLTKALLHAGDPALAEICAWPFADAFVARLLRADVPARMKFGGCRVWVFYDPDGQAVGFGALDLCEDYADRTGGRPHAYIPLLATHPAATGRGYGKVILRHLIDEAALLATRPGCHDRLFLDVYVTSEAAIGLYRTHEFVQLADEPTPDPEEDGKPYLVFARNVGS